MNFHSELTTFLGGSQTFLGVLTTIVVLCVFRSDGNFIYKILEYLTEKIDDQIKKMQDEASKEDEEIPNSKEYKLLQSYVEKSQLEIFRLPSINNGLKLLKEIRLKRTSWCISSIDWGQLYESRERIKSSEEQFVAPLYTFFYCLLIFVADEILRIAPNNLAEFNLQMQLNSY